MPEDNVRLLGELLQSLDAAMVTTTNQGEQLVSRPMAMNVDDFTGSLSFFAPANSRIIANISARPQVNIGYMDSVTSISIAGTAGFTSDMARVSTRWHTGLKPWFPLGTLGAAMIEVTVDEARFWTISAGDGAHRQVVYVSARDIQHANGHPDAAARRT